jgi:hypothetical protein
LVRNQGILGIPSCESQRILNLCLHTVTEGLQRVPEQRNKVHSGKNCLWFPEQHMLVSLICVYWYKALYICSYFSKSIPWGLDLTYYWFVSHFH